MKYILLLILFIAPMLAMAQNPCYVKFTYDDSGNRIKREFVCEPVDTIINNGPSGGGGGSSRPIMEPEEENALLAFDFIVSPNPGSGLFTLEIVGLEEVEGTIEVFNSMYGLLLQRPLQRFYEKIDLRSYASGVYYFRLRTAKGVLTKKVIRR